MIATVNTYSHIAYSIGTLSIASGFWAFEKATYFYWLRARTTRATRRISFSLSRLWARFILLGHGANGPTQNGLPSH